MYARDRKRGPLKSFVFGRPVAEPHKTRACFAHTQTRISIIIIIWCMSYIDAFGYTTRRYTHDTKQPNRKKNKRIPTATTKKNIKASTAQRRNCRVYGTINAYAFYCQCVAVTHMHEHKHIMIIKYIIYAYLRLKIRRHRWSCCSIGPVGLTNARREIQFRNAATTDPYASAHVYDFTYIYGQCAVHTTHIPNYARKECATSTPAIYNLLPSVFCFALLIFYMPKIIHMNEFGKCGWIWKS